MSVTFPAIFVAAIALATLVAAVSAVISLRRAENRRLINLERAVADYRTETEALANSYDGLRETLKRINSRTRMRELRAERKNGSDGLPDPNTDPEGWRDAMQRKYPRGVFSINGAG